MFTHGVNGTTRDRVTRASSACVACPDGSPLVGEVFRNSFHPEFPRLTIFLWIIVTSGGWLTQRWRPVTSDKWTLKIYVPSGVRLAQLYLQAPGAHFHRLLRFAWATAGLFFFPVPLGKKYVIFQLKNTFSNIYIILISSYRRKKSLYDIDSQSFYFLIPSRACETLLRHVSQNSHSCQKLPP